MKRTIFLAMVIIGATVLFAWAYTGTHSGEEIDSAVDIADDIGSTGGIIKSDGSDGITAAVEGVDYYGVGGTDVAIADGGTGSSTASAARTALGLAIGTDVLAPDGDGSSLTALTASQITDQHASTDITADLEEETHASEHAVSAADTIFPTDPNDDLCLQWDDDPGQLVWTACGGSGDLDEADIDTYDELNTIVADQTLTNNSLIDSYSELNTIVSDVTLTSNDLINSLAKINGIVADATFLDDGDIADSTAIGLAAGDTYSAYGDAADDSLNELFDALDTALGLLGGGHAPVTIAATIGSLTLSTQELSVHADIETIADGTFGDTVGLGLDYGDTYTAFGVVGDDSLNELFAALDTALTTLGDSTLIGIDDGTTYTTFGVLADDSINEMFLAIDGAIDALPGGHAAVTLAGGVNALTLSTQEIDVDAYVENIADLSNPATDEILFIDDTDDSVKGLTVDSTLAITGTVMSLADSAVTASKMADADHGHVSWTSTVATVEDFNLSANATVGDDIKISFGNGTDANFGWDTATTPDQFMLDIDNAAIDSEYLITNSDGTYEANVTIEGDLDVGGVITGDASGLTGDGSGLTGVQLTDADVTSIAGGVSGLVYGLGDGSGFEAAGLTENYIWVGNGAGVPAATQTLPDMTFTGIPIIQLSDTISDPTDDDDFIWKYVEHASTVTDIYCIAQGTTPSITLTLQKCDNATCSSPETIEAAITCNGGQDEDNGAIDSGVIAAGTWLKVLFGEPTGTVTFVSWHVKGTQTW